MVKNKKINNNEIKKKEKKLIFMKMIMKENYLLI